jgi:DNA-directed RNA polymerase specialized sigma24 family protein
MGKDSEREDVLNNIGIRLVHIKNSHLFTSVGSGHAYVYTVARNEIRRYLAQRKNRPPCMPLPEDIPEDGPDPELEELKEIVRKCVGQLPAPYQLVITLFMQGYTGADIATMTGICERTQWQYRAKGFQLLRDCLERHGVDAKE